MKERTNDQSLELFADLLEPFAEILQDEEVSAAFKAEKPVRGISVAIKRHKKEVVEILARIDGKDPAEYKVNVLSLPMRLLRLVSLPEVKELFRSQGQVTTAAFSGSATENTEDGAN